MIDLDRVLANVGAAQAKGIGAWRQPWNEPRPSIGPSPLSPLSFGSFLANRWGSEPWNERRPSTNFDPTSRALSDLAWVRSNSPWGDQQRQKQLSSLFTGDQSNFSTSNYTPALAPAQGSNEVADYIREASTKRNIDPNIALTVASREGGFEAAKRGTFKTGSSWWPFQLHYGGKGYEQYGDTAGMGTEFTQKTGFQPGDPGAWKASVDFALDKAKAQGWNAWYGAKAAGITGFMGINQQPGANSQSAGDGTWLTRGKNLLGTPYVWGGKDPKTGLDCSGFVGVALNTGSPESTVTLYSKSAPSQQLQEGDLIFWGMNQNNPGLQHVALYIGNGQIIQSGGTGKGVNIASLNQYGPTFEVRRFGGAGGGVPAGANSGGFVWDRSTWD